MDPAHVFFAAGVVVWGAGPCSSRKEHAMSIYKRGKSWYYDFVHKSQRYTGSFGAVSRTVAKEEEHRSRTRVLEGVLNPHKARKSPRFDTFAHEYLEWVQTNRKPET
jgi:hypothetical protein